MTTVLESLNSGLRAALTENPEVLLLGEDILDPYGGAFKVTRGLSEAFPDRVISTPISEAGIVGIASGMALRGLRPVVEIMFGDFLTLAADALINHAAKFRWMYHDQVRVPIVVRAPMGGRRGYGPTHSQTLEKHFLGTPGLRVIAVGPIGDPGKVLKSCILDGEEPTLFVENKLLYLLKTKIVSTDEEFDIQEFPTRAANGAQTLPCYLLTIRGAPPPVITIATYGYMTEIALQAAIRLAYESEIFVEIATLTQLAPFDLSVVLSSVARTRCLLTLEEGAHDLGWGAEVLAQALELFGSEMITAGRITALQMPVPASGPLEMAVLPDTDRVVEFCKNLIAKRQK